MIPINRKMIMMAAFVIIALIALQFLLEAFIGFSIVGAFILILDPHRFMMMALATILVLGGIYIAWKGLLPSYWRFIVPGIMFVIAFLAWTGRF